MNQNTDDKKKSAKHKAEQLWQTLKQERDDEKVKLKTARGAAKESNEDIAESLHQLMNDIKAGYHNIREKMR
jgi:hypothetical protein